MRYGNEVWGMRVGMSFGDNDWEMSFGDEVGVEVWENQPRVRGDVGTE